MLIVAGGVSCSHNYVAFVGRVSWPLSLLQLKVLEIGSPLIDDFAVFAMTFRHSCCPVRPINTCQFKVLGGITYCWPPVVSLTHLPTNWIL